MRTPKRCLKYDSTRNFHHQMSTKTRKERMNQVHNYDTRNASSFHVRTNIRRFSFQYQGPLFFNSLSPDVVSSVSVSALKKKS